MLFYIVDRLPRFHCRRDGRARQRAIPGGDCGAALRRANRAGDAVGRRGIARICRATRRRSRTARSRFRRTRTCWQTIARSCSNNGVAKISERRAGSDGKGRHGDSAMAAALAFFASRAEVGKIAVHFGARRMGKREEFEGRGNPFGSAPVEDEIGAGGRSGF